MYVLYLYALMFYQMILLVAMKKVLGSYSFHFKLAHFDSLWILLQYKFTVPNE